MPHISLTAEIITYLGNFPITNSLIATWIVMAVMFAGAFLVTRHLTLVPSLVQSVAEIIVGGLYDFFSSVIGDHIKQAFPLIASLFLFIIFANWFGLLPGVGTIGFREGKKTEAVREVRHTETPRGAQENQKEKFVPMLRGPTADLNTTLALALVSIIAIQYFGFKTVGARYTSRFINVSSPIYFFLGILEIISELSKVISFAFRLFGNIFAGEVLLTVMAFLMPIIVPLPFLMLELFVGFIQALVFSMLTAVFLKVALAHGAESHG